MKHLLKTPFISLAAICLTLTSALPSYAFRQVDLKTCQKVQGPKYYQACIRLMEMASLPPKILATANYGVGSHYYWKKQYKKAIPYFNKTIELYPTHPWAYIRKGRSFSALEQYKKAIRIFNQGINYHTQPRPEAYYNRGYAYAMVGEYDKAIEDLSRYIKVKPKDALARHHRGYALYKKGNLRSAITDFSGALRYNPNASQIYQHRADAFYNLGNYPKAILDYSAALNFKPKNPLYLYKRGMSFRHAGNLTKSIQDCTAAQSINPYYISAYYCLAQGYVRRFF